MELLLFLLLLLIISLFLDELSLHVDVGFGFGFGVGGEKGDTVMSVWKDKMVSNFIGCLSLKGKRDLSFVF